MPVHRLRSARDVKAVLSTRPAAGGRVAVLYGRQRADDGSARATVVAGRKVGAAVERNRAKRRLRAALHHMDVPEGLDLVVLAKPGADELAFSALQQELRTLLSRLVGAGPRS